MFKDKELEDLGLSTTNGYEWFDFDSTIMFDRVKREFYSCNEVDEPELICRINNINHLKEVLELTCS